MHWSIRNDRNETYFWTASFRNHQCLGRMQYTVQQSWNYRMFSLPWHWSYSRLDRRALIIIVLTTLCSIEFTHFSDERCIEVENRGKNALWCPRKCTFYWGLISKDKEGKKAGVGKNALSSKKTLYWGTLYQESTVQRKLMSQRVKAHELLVR